MLLRNTEILAGQQTVFRPQTSAQIRFIRHFSDDPTTFPAAKELFKKFPQPPPGSMEQQARKRPAMQEVSSSWMG